MTTAEPNRNEMEAGDGPSSECVLYLLGELDAETAKRFEEKLADNAELSELLLQQASLITAVAQSRALEVPPLQHSACDDAHADAPQQWRWVAGLVSIAACIALLFQFQRFDSQPGSTVSTLDRSTIQPAAILDESVLIAKAWASSHPTLNFETGELRTGESEVDLADPDADESFDLVLDDRPNDIDATMSWMFVAISSSFDADSEEGNDG